MPGHEVCGRIVAVGSAVTRHRIGERVLVQTDYRHLPTDGANASFGYTFEGGLQEYVLMDERVIIEPDTGERFLIPVDEAPSASAVALLEPWACVERAYATEERSSLTPGGRLLRRGRCRAHGRRSGRARGGLRPRAGHGAACRRGPACRARGRAGRGAASSVPIASAADLAGLPSSAFDDIVYLGSDAGRIEELERRLAPRGVIDVVLGGEVPSRPVEVDVGRIHYDLTRWVGTTGSSAADGYAMAPGTAELRDGERVAVIGAAGPMGFMHVIRALTSDRRDLHVTAVDIDPARLDHLADVAGPIAAANGVDFSVIDSREAQLEPGFTRLGVMVPSPALAADAVRLAGDGAILDLFAGFAVGTRAPLDLGELIRKHVYMIGTSGSVISDMKAVLAKLEAGHAGHEHQRRRGRRHGGRGRRAGRRPGTDVGRQDRHLPRPGLGRHGAP